MVYPSTGGVVSAAAAAAEPSDVWRCLLTRESRETTESTEQLRITATTSTTGHRRPV